MRLIILAFTVISSFPFVASAMEEKNTDSNPGRALQLTWLDKSINPGENFYDYANGSWKKQNPVPPEYSSWGTFYILQQKNQKIIQDMLIAAAANTSAPVGSIEQKVGDFYFSGMNQTSIDKLGIEPLQPQLNRINSIKNKEDLQAVITELHLIGVDVFFDFGSMQDYKNSKEMIGVAMQGGLGLPDRDYYFKKEEKFQKIRDAYVQHIAKIFELSGDNSILALKEAQTVMDIETKFAEASMTQTAMRDPHAVYNMRNIRELRKITPDFSWPEYFQAIGQSKIKRINIATPAFFKTMDLLMKQVSLSDWQIYLRWHLLDAFTSYLSQPFVDENFNMDAALTGTKKLLPRWKRVVDTENSLLGFAIGKLYVEKYFPPSAKQDVLDIVQNIRASLRRDIQTLEWMSPATRKAALRKLDLIEERVGYPDKWWDYSTLLIDRGPYVLNVIRANRFLINRNLDKIGKPIDRTEWGMTPQTINAYYDPSMNNINLPAGILQPPFFDLSAPAAVNYGAIGFVIGHELTHGFDDQGAQFDGNGNLKNWWTKQDLKNFKLATDCIVAQFSQYKVEENLPVQGNLVVGEATADLGGLTLAYNAFKASKAYKEAKTIDGLTPDQQFFLSSAHVWASNIRPEQARNLVMIDPHPPTLYRVNGTLANMPQFQQAFGIQAPSPMVNTNRCVIW